MKIIRKIQQALISYFNRNLPITEVYSHIPNDAIYPLIKVSNLKATPWKSSTYTGYKITSKIQIISQKESPKEVMNLMEETENLINDNNMTLKDLSKMLSVEITSGEINQDLQAKFWVGNINLEIQILVHNHNYPMQTQLFTTNASY